MGRQPPLLLLLTLCLALFPERADRAREEGGGGGEGQSYSGMVGGSMGDEENDSADFI